MRQYITRATSHIVRSLPHGRPQPFRQYRRPQGEAVFGRKPLAIGASALVAVIAVAVVLYGYVASKPSGIGAGVTAAAFLGLAIPNLLRLMRRDPQVAAGPVALALTDMITLVIYLNLARWLLTQE